MTFATASEIRVDATLAAVLSDLGGTADFLCIQRFCFRPNDFGKISVKKTWCIGSDMQLIHNE